MLPVWFLSVFLTGYSLFQTITGSEETLGSPFVNNSVQQAIKLVDRAYKESRASMKQKLLKRSASISDLMTFSKQPVAKTRNVARSAEYLQMTLSLIRHSVHRIHKRSLNISDIITSNDLNHIFQSTGCSSLTRLPDCPKDPVSDLYRTINGQCNNRISPLLGASDIPLKRWLRAEYEDGFSLARGSSGKCYSGYPLPLVRVLSNLIVKFIRDTEALDFRFTQMLMQWGQWADHDLSLTVLSGSDGINCGVTCSTEEPCFPIKIITYKDYLPKILGPKAMKKFLPVYRGYDSSIDSSIKNVFSTAAFRFGHSTVSEVVPRLKIGYKEDPEFPNLQMRETFFNPSLLISAGQIERLLRGLINFPNKLSTQNAIMVADLRDHLFENISRITQDLASLNMQRGRDHGLRGYGDWREFCGLQAPKNRMDLSKLLKNPQLANELIKLYGTPKNIDLWLAGIIEPFVRGGRVGPLFACLIGKQFRDVRNGDRFWWEKQGVFTAEQRQALRSISLARIICDNTRIKRLTRDVFVFHLFPENYVNCRQIPKLDLRAWKVANVYPDTS